MILAAWYNSVHKFARAAGGRAVPTIRLVNIEEQLLERIWKQIQLSYTSYSQLNAVSRGAVESIVLSHFVAFLNLSTMKIGSAFHLRTVVGSRNKAPRIWEGA